MFYMFMRDRPVEVNTIMEVGYTKPNKVRGDRVKLNQERRGYE